MESRKVTAENVRKELFSLADEKYREFHSRLVPGEEKILGVRMPKLRALAKTLGKMDWEEWFLAAEDIYYEETMLRGLVMAGAKMEYDKRFSYIRRFLPSIHNWAVCDCVCSTLRDAKKYPEEYWAFLEPYFSSDREFEARFGAVMLLGYFVKREYLEEALARIESIHQEGYYAKMAAAWAISVYFAAFPEEVLAYLRGNHGLDEFTYKKSLQKILESYRVDSETKEIIKGMRQRG